MPDWSACLLSLPIISHIGVYNTTCILTCSSTYRGHSACVCSILLMINRFYTACVYQVHDLAYLGSSACQLMNLHAVNLLTLPSGD